MVRPPQQTNNVSEQVLLGGVRLQQTREYHERESLRERDSHQQELREDGLAEVGLREEVRVGAEVRHDEMQHCVLQDRIRLEFAQDCHRALNERRVALLAHLSYNIQYAQFDFHNVKYESTTDDVKTCTWMV